MRKQFLKIISLILISSICLAFLSGCSFLGEIGSACADFFGDTDDDYDIAGAINKISTEIMSGIITLQVEHYNLTIFGTKQVVATSLGSAVIISRDGDTYYALTNAHCVNGINTARHRDIYAADYRGNLIEGVELYGENSISVYYDLALIRFTQQKEELSPISLAEESASEGERVFSLGSPHAQANCLTTGSCLGLYESSLVDFDVMMHDAPIGSGSSGGALLDDELKLCGVNFSGEENKEFGYGGAIPIERVREFLSGFEYFKDL